MPITAPYPNAMAPNWYYQPTQATAGYNPNPFQYRFPREEHVVRVHGIEGARAYALPPNPMPPNSDVILLDDSEPYAYLVVTDGAAYPSVDRFKVTPDPVAETSQAEVDRLNDEIEHLKKTIAQMKEELHAEPDIQQPASPSRAVQPTIQQPDAVRPQGGYDWGYQAPVRPDAGQPQP